MESATKTRTVRQEYSHLISRSAFIFLCRTSGAGLAFFTQILLARWIGAAELGVYVLAFSWCILLATVVTFGLPLAAIRFVGEAIAAKQPAVIQGFLRWGQNAVLLSSLGFAAALTAGLLLGPVDLDTEQRSAFVVAFLVLPFFALINFHTGVANAFSHFSLSFLPNNVIRPLIFLVALGAAWLTGEPLSAATVMKLHGLVIVVVSAGTVWFVFRYMNTSFASQTRQQDTHLWLRTSAPLMVLALFTGYFPEFTVILVGSMLSPDSLAVYHVAFRIALLISFALYAVDAYLGPAAAQLLAQGDLEKLQQSVNRATRLRFFGALIAFGILALIGKFVLRLFGDEFIVGYAALLLLAFGELIHAAAGPVTRLMSISGHQDKCLYVFGCCLVGAVAMIAILTPPFGINGAATAAMLTVITWSVWMRQLVIRHLRIKPSIV